MYIWISNAKEYWYIFISNETHRSLENHSFIILEFFFILRDHYMIISVEYEIKIVDDIKLSCVLVLNSYQWSTQTTTEINWDYIHGQFNYFYIWPINGPILISYLALLNVLSFITLSISIFVYFVYDNSKSNDKRISNNHNSKSLKW